MCFVKRNFTSTALKDMLFCFLYLNISSNINSLCVFVLYVNFVMKELSSMYVQFNLQFWVFVHEGKEGPVVSIPHPYKSTSSSQPAMASSSVAE